MISMTGFAVIGSAIIVVVVGMTIIALKVLP